MNYWLNLFSPDTYETFSASDRTVSGFRRNQKARAQKIVQGDRFVCYLTKLSRWVGILEVIEGPFISDSPLFYEEEDPFVVRFKVRPLTWLTKEQAAPIKDDEVWNRLSFTKSHQKGSSTWTGKLRSSLNKLPESDGQFLDQLLRREGRSKPKNGGEPSGNTIPESIQMQALLACLGARWKYDIWVPAGDRGQVAKAIDQVAKAIDQESPVQFLETLPLSYDHRTIKTVERIDVLWLQGSAIVRAFEVEHTTAVYSGILRMADLLALQPNMNINLHIVAPETRRDKVFSEIRRPAFSQLNHGPLAGSCTYIPYGAIQAIMKEPHLDYLDPNFLQKYVEEAVVLG